MAQKNKQAPFGTQSSADAQRSEMFEASVLKSASMEAQQIVQEGEKEARQIVEQARHSRRKRLHRHSQIRTVTM